MQPGPPVRAAPAQPAGGLLSPEPHSSDRSSAGGLNYLERSCPDRCSAAGRESVDPPDHEPWAHTLARITSLLQNLGRAPKFPKPVSSASGTNSHCGAGLGGNGTTRGGCREVLADSETQAGAGHGKSQGLRGRWQRLALRCPASVSGVGAARRVRGPS